MKTEVLNHIREWLGPIRQQMEANRRALLTQTMGGKTGGGPMSRLLQSTQNIKTFDPGAMHRDLQIRGLFMRIKYANIARGQRDSLSTVVRNLAADDRLGSKTIGKIYQMVSLVEAFGGTGREKNSLFAIGNSEKTVDEEMDAVCSLRDLQKAQEDRINDLRSGFSLFA